ncbi:hypothetical protein PLESTF_000659300 [Pleodorina starrii]|nr:hypothetical protein PLESTF_000659300 [Pleodorina starrii]
MVFGPCACLGGAWGSGSVNPGEVNSSDVDAEESASLPGVHARPAAAPNAAGCFFGFFRSSRPEEPAAEQRPANHQPLLNGTVAQPPLYNNDAAVAPVPEPAFGTSTPQGASPQKAVPVPKRLLAAAAMENGGDGPLPPAVAIEPPAAVSSKAAEPAPAKPTPPGRLAPDDPATAAIGPQLGTWADRQYRLLDPVPERGELGPGSTSGNSSNNRSPNTTVMLGHNGRTASATGSGSGGCGSASGDYSGGGSSSTPITSQAPPASPTLLDLLHKQQQQQQAQPNHQRHGAQESGRQLQPFMNGDTHAQVREGLLQLQQQNQQQPAAAIDVAQRQVDPEALIQEAAWRWRFTRRWQAEQSRTDAACSAPKDQMEEALAYLNATNATTTVSMQIANTSNRGGGGRGGGAGLHGSGSRGGGGMSLDGSLMLTSGMVGTLGAAGSTLGGDWQLGACGSGSGSFTSGPRILGRQPSGELLAASREVASLNRRAAAVLQQQMDCELQAERRVQESLGQGPPWVGQLIPIVQIDEWGSFRFLMLKLRDQGARGGVPGSSERQRIVIRGHNYGSEGQLMEECNREILALAHKHGLPFEAPTCMGGGVMEWRRDRDRHLHLHSGFVMDRALPLAAGGMAGGGLVAPANGGRPASAMDLLNLAAALARQSFPTTYKITVLT